MSEEDAAKVGRARGTDREELGRMREDNDAWGAGKLRVERMECGTV